MIFFHLFYFDDIEKEFERIFGLFDNLKTNIPKELVKEYIKINAKDNVVEIRTNDSIRKYYKTLELPSDAYINAAKSTYNKGLLNYFCQESRNEIKR